MDFATQEVMDEYLKDHPDADKSNHRVVKKVKGQKAGECPGHLKKVFEEGTVPLRKRLCMGDDVAFMDGKTYHIGTLHGFDEGSGMQVTLRDGTKFSVPKEDLRMPPGGKRLRDSFDRRIEAFRGSVGANKGGMAMQKIAGELVKLAKSLVGLERLSPFEDALRQAISGKIKEEQGHGTTVMSIENLMQIVRPPSSMLEGAPRGTNARYYYAEMFRNLCQRREFRSFIYGDWK